MKVPFGLDKATNRFVGIDEVKNGLACGCICPSCKMQLKARQGEGNEHHFAHHLLKIVNEQKQSVNILTGYLYVLWQNN